jgi:hypothetical protein
MVSVEDMLSIVYQQKGLWQWVTKIKSTPHRRGLLPCRFAGNLVKDLGLAKDRINTEPLFDSYSAAQYEGLGEDVMAIIKKPENKKLLFNYKKNTEALCASENKQFRSQSRNRFTV